MDIIKGENRKVYNGGCIGAYYRCSAHDTPKMGLNFLVVFQQIEKRAFVCDLEKDPQ